MTKRPTAIAEGIADRDRRRPPQNVEGGEHEAPTTHPARASFARHAVILPSTWETRARRQGLNRAFHRSTSVTGGSEGWTDREDVDQVEERAPTGSPPHQAGARRTAVAPSRDLSAEPPWARGCCAPPSPHHRNGAVRGCRRPRPVGVPVRERYVVRRVLRPPAPGRSGPRGGTADALALRGLRGEQQGVPVSGPGTHGPVPTT